MNHVQSADTVFPYEVETSKGIKLAQELCRSEVGSSGATGFKNFVPSPQTGSNC